MAMSRSARYIGGIWGPYYSAILPDYWLNEGGQSTTRRRTTSSSRSDSLGEAFAKSLARQIGGKAGQAIVRGVLGSLFRSR